MYRDHSTGGELVMIDLASALVAPLAKLLLKSWLGDTGADMGMNLYGLAIGGLKDKVAARAAVRQANTVANAVATNFETFLLNERVDEDSIEPAAFELGETISRHVTTEFLISKQLDVAAIQNGLLAARPVDQIYRPIAHRPR
jgi:hypothetical protein